MVSSLIKHVKLHVLKPAVDVGKTTHENLEEQLLEMYNIRTRLFHAFLI